MSDIQYEKARKRVKKKKEFYEHLATYAVMSVFFVVLNLVTSPWNLWFFWPIIGWGFAVVFHYLDVFGVPGVGTLSKEWEEKAIEDELRKMQNRPYLEQPEEKEDGLELRQIERRDNKDWSEDELV